MIVYSICDCFYNYYYFFLIKKKKKLNKKQSNTTGIHNTPFTENGRQTLVTFLFDNYLDIQYIKKK